MTEKLATMADHLRERLSQIPPANPEKVAERAMTAKDIAEAVRDNPQVSRAIAQLRERWEDEKGVEDIEDYLPGVRAVVPEAYKMLERPWGFRAKGSDRDVRVTLQLAGQHWKVCCTFE